MASLNTPHTDNLLRVNALGIDLARARDGLREAVEALREIREGHPMPMRRAGAALDSIERHLAGDEPERASPAPHEPAPGVPHEHHGEPCPTCGSTDTDGQLPELACHSCGRAPYPEGD